MINYGDYEYYEYYEDYSDDDFDVTCSELDKRSLTVMAIIYILLIILVNIILVIYLKLFLIIFLVSIVSYHMYLKGTTKYRLNNNIFMDYLFTLIILNFYVFIIDCLFKEDIYLIP